MAKIKGLKKEQNASEKQLLEYEEKRNLLMNPCKTKAELKDWIEYYLDLDMPDNVVSRYADISPMDAIWEMYKICVWDDNEEQINELLYVASRGSGKCCVKGTVCLTPDGPKRIEDFEPDDLIWTGQSFKRVIQKFDEGHKVGVEIKCTHNKIRSPMSLTASLQHRIIAIKDDGNPGWVKVKDLRIGDLVLRSFPNLYDNKIDRNSEEFQKGWLLGGVLNSNPVKRHEIFYYSPNTYTAKHYITLVHKYFGLKHKVKEKTVKSMLVYCDHPDYRTFCEEYLIEDSNNGWSGLKHLDHSVNFLAGVLAGAFDSNAMPCEFKASSESLIDQFSYIMTVLGIKHARKSRPFSGMKYKSYGRRFTAYIMEAIPHWMRTDYRDGHIVWDQNSWLRPEISYQAELFDNFVSYFTKRYEFNDEGYCEELKSKLPFFEDFFLTLMFEEKRRNAKVRTIDRDTVLGLIKWLKEVGEDYWANTLGIIASGVWGKVSTMKPGSYYFYDLEVAEEHTYWSNGFISHNTLGAAIAEFAIMLHNQRDVAHVGAILAQAKRAYAYLQDFYLKPKVKEVLSPEFLPLESQVLQKNTMEKSTFILDNTQVSIEVLPTTLKALNGSHVGLVVADEIDTVSGEGLRAFKEISGMLDTKRGKKPLRVGISTRKSTYGLMNRQMENAHKEGRHVRKWTALEFTERCPESRHGLTSSTFYINENAGEVINRVDYDLKPAERKADYTPHQLYDGCYRCPAAPWCLTDASRQTSKSPMLKTINELNQKILSEGADWSAAQLFNRKPSSEGIIFKEFSPDKHVKTWNEMWKILTGKDFPGVCTHDLFIKQCHSLKLSCYAGVDFGWSNPSTVVYMFIDSRENIFIVRAEGVRYVNDPNWVHYMKTKMQPIYRAQLYFPDIANGSAVDLMKPVLPVCDDIDKSINLGIQTIKRFLFTPGSGEAKFFIAKEGCDGLIDEMLKYHSQIDTSGMALDVPEDDYNHFIDPIRYILVALFAKRTFLFSGEALDIQDAKIMDGNGHYFRPPTPEEFAKTQGIPLNDEVQPLGKMGAIGTASELNLASEGEDEVQGDGGFLFSF
jgi:hypothetical protein